MPATQTTLSTEALIRTLRYLISNCLSHAVVVGSSILKVPQIYKIWRSQSASGVSLFANEIELLAYVVSLSWGIVQQLDFRDFGENGIIFIQLIILVLLVSKLQNRTQQAVMVLTAELGLFGIFAMGYIPTSIHKLLLSSQVLINISSRVPQIIMNYRNSSTGQLSFLTFLLAFGGGIARVMTTALNVPRSKGKLMLLTQYSVAAILNSIILSQMAYYQYIRKKHTSLKSSRHRL